jgi:hypothetical protein
MKSFSVLFSGCGYKIIPFDVPVPLPVHGHNPLDRCAGRRVCCLSLIASPLEFKVVWFVLYMGDDQAGHQTQSAVQENHKCIRDLLEWTRKHRSMARLRRYP